MAALSLSGLSDDALDAGIAELAQTMGGHLAALGRGNSRPARAEFRFCGGGPRACRRTRGYGARKSIAMDLLGLAMRMAVVESELRLAHEASVAQACALLAEQCRLVIGDLHVRVAAPAADDDRPEGDRR